MSHIYLEKGGKETTEELVRVRGLGFFHILPDDVLSEHILSKLQPKDLANCQQLSRYFYVFARDDTLWRRHCIEKLVNDKEAMNDFMYKGSWFLSYLFPTRTMNEIMKQRYEYMALLRKAEMYFPEVKSMYLHTKWLRCHMDLSDFLPAPTIHPSIPIEDYNKLSISDFDAKFRRPMRPCLFHNSGIKNTKAWLEWTNLKRFSEKYPSLQFRVANETNGPHKYIRMSLTSYADYMLKQHDETPLYVFDSEFGDKCPEMETEYEIPKYFDEDYFGGLSKDKRPSYRWVIIGPKRSAYLGASWHIDPIGTSAWNTLLKGRKRWALYPPNILPPGLTTRRPSSGHQSISEDNSESNSTPSLLWYLEVYPFLPPNMRPIECVQMPGETIFVPSGWWHMVLNLDETVAVTQNFADHANFENVCDALLVETRRRPKRAETWRNFQEHISATHPHLVPIMAQKSDQFSDMIELTNDPIVKAEGYETKAKFVESFKSLEVWEPRVTDLLRRIGIWTEKQSQDIVSVRGVNPIFRTQHSIIKFYSHIYGSYKAYLAELHSLRALHDQIDRNAIVIPNIYSSGYLFPDAEREGKWPWPYIALEIVDAISIGDIVAPAPSNRVSEKSESFGTRLSVQTDWVEVVQWLAKTLKEIHSTTVTTNSPTEPVSTFVDLEWLEKRLSSAPQRQKSWGLFPCHLIDQIETYLPKSVDELIGTEEQRKTWAGLLHMDLNGDNIMGVIEPLVKSVDINDPPLSVYSIPDTNVYGPPPGPPPPNEPFSVLPPPQNFRWRPTTIIDFGDALTMGGDPVIDLVVLYTTVFRSNKDFLRLFVDVYNALPGRTQIDVDGFSRRAMWYTLMWQFQGPIRWILRDIELDGLKNWEEVENIIWAI